jgi:hypothetical protein
VDERTPDLAAVSEESPALPGVLAAGTYSGSVAILNGTSDAVPQVTRALADQIATRGNPELLEGKTAAAALKSAVTALKSAITAQEQEPALAAPQNSGLGRKGYKLHRPLRDGVGRLPFTFRSYPKRIGD